MRLRADVAQLAEHRLPKPRVAGSIPVVRFSSLGREPGLAAFRQVSGPVTHSAGIRQKPARWLCWLAHNWRALGNRRDVKSAEQGRLVDRVQGEAGAAL